MTWDGESALCMHAALSIHRFTLKAFSMQGYIAKGKVDWYDLACLHVPKLRSSWSNAATYAALVVRWQWRSQCRRAGVITLVKQLLLIYINSGHTQVRKSHSKLDIVRTLPSSTQCVHLALPQRCQVEQAQYSSSMHVTVQCNLEPMYIAQLKITPINFFLAIYAPGGYHKKWLKSHHIMLLADNCYDNILELCMSLPLKYSIHASTN